MPRTWIRWHWTAEFPFSQILGIELGICASRTCRIWVTKFDAGRTGTDRWFAYWYWRTRIQRTGYYFFLDHHCLINQYHVTMNGISNWTVLTDHPHTNLLVGTEQRCTVDPSWFPFLTTPFFRTTWSSHPGDLSCYTNTLDEWLEDSVTNWLCATNAIHEFCLKQSGNSEGGWSDGNS